MALLFWKGYGVVQIALLESLSDQWHELGNLGFTLNLSRLHSAFFWDKGVDTTSEILKVLFINY